MADDGVIATRNQFSIQSVIEAKALVYKPASITVAGLYAANDGGGGIYNWVAGSNAATDDVMCFECEEGEEGRYVRQLQDGSVHTNWWRAKGLGDSDGLIAALATGHGVKIDGGDWTWTKPATMQSSGQSLTGYDADTVISLDGAFDVLTLTGEVEGMYVGNFRFNGAGHIGGTVISINGAHRTEISDIEGYVCFNWFHCEGANFTTMNDIFVYGVTGEFMFNLYGTPSIRSDVLAMNNVVVSSVPYIEPEERPYGFVHDGNFHTIDGNAVRLVNPRKGYIARATTGNASSGTIPSYINLTNFQVDFPTYEALDLIDAWDPKFTAGYFSNSLMSANVRVGPGVYMGSIIGGLCAGAAQDGMVIGAKDFQIIGPTVAGNSWGAGNFGKYPGVRIAATAERISLSAVKSGGYDLIGGTQSYGLEIDEGAVDVTWAGGALGNNLKGEWLIHGDSSTHLINAAGKTRALNNGIVTTNWIGRDVVLLPTVTDGEVVSAAIDNGGAHLDPNFPPSVFATDFSGAGAGFAGHLTIVNGVATGLVVDSVGANYDPDQTVMSCAYYPSLTPLMEVAGKIGTPVISSTVALYDPVSAPTFAAAQALSLASGFNSIRTQCYRTPGDKGGALYVPVPSMPAHPGRLQLASGQWCEIAEVEVLPQMLGAYGDYTTGNHDDSEALLDWFATIRAQRLNGVVGRLCGRYYSADSITFDYAASSPYGGAILADKPGIDGIYFAADKVCAFESSSGPVYYETIEGHIETTVDGVGFRIGKNDFSDAWNRINLRLVVNNGAQTKTAETCRLNYVLHASGSIVANGGGSGNPAYELGEEGDEGYGIVVRCRQLVMSMLEVGAGNGNIGMLLDGGSSYGNLFTTPDIEEVSTGIKIAYGGVIKNRWEGGTVVAKYIVDAPSGGYNDGTFHAQVYAVAGAAYVKPSGERFRMINRTDTFTPPSLPASTVALYNLEGRRWSFRAFGNVSAATIVRASGETVNLPIGNGTLVQVDAHLDPYDSVMFTYTVAPGWAAWTED